MYNILISVGLGFIMASVVFALGFGAIPAILPAILVSTITLYLLTQRTAAAVNAELEGLVPLLQNRQVDEAEALLRSIQERYGKWQLMLDGQISGQLGMIKYMQLKYDEAMPLLQAGTFQNWAAQVCIGLIHHRRNELDQTWEWLDKAAGTAPKEVMIPLIHGTLRSRAGDRDGALQAIATGLENVGDNNVLKRLQKTIANKKKIKTSEFPEVWLQFFPEEAAQQMMMRGRRGQLSQMEQARKVMEAQARKGKGRNFRPR